MTDDPNVETPHVEPPRGVFDSLRALFDTLVSILHNRAELLTTELEEELETPDRGGVVGAGRCPLAGRRCHAGRHHGATCHSRPVARADRGVPGTRVPDCRRHGVRFHSQDSARETAALRRDLARVGEGPRSLAGQKVSARSTTFAERREALLARSDENRAEMAAIFGGLERKFAVAETVVKVARGLSRLSGPLRCRRLVSDPRASRVPHLASPHHVGHTDRPPGVPHREDPYRGA